MATPIRPENLWGLPDSEKEAQVEELHHVRLERERTELQEQLKRMQELSVHGDESPNQQAVEKIQKRLAEIEEDLKPKAMSATAGK